MLLWARKFDMAKTSVASKWQENTFEGNINFAGNGTYS